MDPCTAWRCVRGQEWKYVEIEGGKTLLFDLKNDPNETTNLATLPDGRVFDAEKCLYDARWLTVPPNCTGGIIPQMFG